MYILQHVHGKQLLQVKSECFFLCSLSLDYKSNSFPHVSQTSFFFSSKLYFCKFSVSTFIILMLNCCRTFKAHEVVPLLGSWFYWWCYITFVPFCFILYLNVYWQPLFTGAHLVGGGGSRGPEPLPFFNTVQIVSSNYSTSLEETLWKFSLKNKRIHQNDGPAAFSWSFSMLL